MTVPQYVTKFNELARFAPHQVDMEERKARRFEQGLKPWLYDKITALQIDNYPKHINIHAQQEQKFQHYSRSKFPTQNKHNSKEYSYHSYDQNP